LNKRHIPFRALNQIWFDDVLIQVASLGEPLFAGKRSGLNRTRHFANHLPPDTVAFTTTWVSEVVKMATDVADYPILLCPTPIAHLAWPHRGNTPEVPVTKILEERSEVPLNIFLRIPSILEVLFDFLP